MSSPIYYFILQKEIEEYMSCIEKSAQHSVKKKDYVAAMWKYMHAVKICQFYRLSDLQRFAIDCTSIGLKIRGEDEKYGLKHIYKVARWVIKLIPNCAEVRY